MKDKRMLDVGIRNFSPSLVHTPNAYFSINSCIENSCFVAKITLWPLNLLYMVQKKLFFK